MARKLRGRRSATPAPVTRAEFRKLQRQVAHVLAVVKANASVIETNAEKLDIVSRDCAANLRRCAELQLEIDRLKKTPFFP